MTEVRVAKARHWSKTATLALISDSGSCGYNHRELVCRPLPELRSDGLPTFTTTSRDVARKFRAAWLAGRVINADVLGASFSRAKVCWVKRDPLSASGRWSIEVEEAKSDWLPIYAVVLAASGMSAHPPILDLNIKRRPPHRLRIGPFANNE